jgi:hypothetical protein
MNEKETKKNKFIIEEEQAEKPMPKEKVKRYRFKNGVAKMTYKGSVIEAIHLTENVVKLYAKTPIGFFIEEY